GARGAEVPGVPAGTWHAPDNGWEVAMARWLARACAGLLGVSLLLASWITVPSGNRLSGWVVQPSAQSAPSRWMVAVRVRRGFQWPAPTVDAVVQVLPDAGSAGSGGAGWSPAPVSARIVREAYGSWRMEFDLDSLPEGRMVGLGRFPDSHGVVHRDGTVRIEPLAAVGTMMAHIAASGEERAVLEAVGASVEAALSDALGDDFARAQRSGASGAGADPGRIAGQAVGALFLGAIGVCLAAMAQGWWLRRGGPGSDGSGGSGGS
ncbi:MAG: hypothetical protein ACTS3F_00165, partial [Phycisphaerales bacterium]